MFCDASFSDHAERVETLIVFVQVRQSQGGNAPARFDLHPLRIEQTRLYEREMEWHHYTVMLHQSDGPTGLGLGLASSWRRTFVLITVSVPLGFRLQVGQVRVQGHGRAQSG